MSDNNKMIDCGICKFQLDGRVSLTSIMRKHKLNPDQEIRIFIKLEDYKNV